MYLKVWIWYYISVWMARKLKNYIVQHQHESLRVESLELYIDFPSSIIIPRIVRYPCLEKMDDIASYKQMEYSNSPRRSSWIRFVTVNYMCTKCRLDIIFGLSTFLFLKQDTAYDYLRTPETLYNLQFLLKAVEFFRNVNSCQKKLIRNYILYRYISIRVCGGTDASVPFWQLTIALQSRVDHVHPCWPKCKKKNVKNCFVHFLF